MQRAGVKRAVFKNQTVARLQFRLDGILWVDLPRWNLRIVRKQITSRRDHGHAAPRFTEISQVVGALDEQARNGSMSHIVHGHRVVSMPSRQPIRIRLIGCIGLLVNQMGRHYVQARP